ncbi:hypothetical protein AN644_03185 [Candidatus Epulonipiscium fishelsonii]|nr:hypothetical protein AN644_03185 [Epulopiscium sp. SCG-C06WGA-EpuloA1]
MSVIYNKKIEITFKKNDVCILDNQSKICNWLYNYLLEVCIKDYMDNNDSLKLLDGRNLRNYATSLKKEYPFLKTVYSAPLKECAYRIKRAYIKSFTSSAGLPNFRSWKKKWFSLVFDEPFKGWEVKDDGNIISVSLGKIPDLPVEDGKRNPSVLGKLKVPMILEPDERYKLFSLVKKDNKFYGIFTIEKQLPLIHSSTSKWIVLNLETQDFFISLDYKGDILKFKQINLVKYWDNQIYNIKAKRDDCKTKYKKYTTSGAKFTIHSSRWNKLNDALNTAKNTKQSQLKGILFQISLYLYKHYDLIVVTDYTSNVKPVGYFRRILKWTSEKQQKHFIINSHPKENSVDIEGTRHITRLAGYCVDELYSSNKTLVGEASFKEGLHFKEI